MRKKWEEVKKTPERPDSREHQSGGLKKSEKFEILRENKRFF